MTEHDQATRLIGGLKGIIGRLRDFLADCLACLGPGRMARLRRREEALARIERHFRAFVDEAPIGIYRSTPDGRLVSANRKLADMLGYASPEEFLSEIKDLASQLYVDPTVRQDVLDRVVRSEIRNEEIRFRCRDGGLAWVSVNLRPILDDQGRVLYFDGFAQDISRRKTAESRLKRSLREKQLLLREIQHRVKNNLQVLSSLLELTMGRARAEETVSICREVQGYIRCIALIHAMLSRRNTADSVRMDEFARELFDSMAGIYRERRIEVRFSLDEVCLHLDKALPCGMLLNELYTNVFKHAFPGGERGAMRVELSLLDDGMVRLEVGDDGVGISGTRDVRGGDAMGMKLVASLAAQLHGELQLVEGPGTAVRVTFPGDPPQDRLTPED